MSQPEAWLLGRVEGFPDALMPAVHSLTQARRELVALRDAASTTDCLATPGGAASVGFHIAHITGSLDRLFTYARDEPLSPDQLDYLSREAEIARALSKDELLDAALQRVDVCLETLRNVPRDLLLEPRRVGRDRLPSNVIGLLFHAAEHPTMHVGQIRTTLKIIRSPEDDTRAIDRRRRLYPPNS
jgi:hypothetical protein